MHAGMVPGRGLQIYPFLILLLSADISAFVLRKGKNIEELEWGETAWGHYFKGGLI